MRIGSVGARGVQLPGWVERQQSTATLELLHSSRRDGLWDGELGAEKGPFWSTGAWERAALVWVCWVRAAPGEVGYTSTLL